MDLRLGGRRALVTGASSGLGEEIVRVLAAEGASVVVHGRDEARTAAVVDSLRAAGGDATGAIGDLATDAGADAVRDAVDDSGAPVDVLVNNAGFYDITLGWDTASPDAWAEIYNVNVISGVRMIRRFVPGMRERGWGRVIQISSLVGRSPVAGYPHYVAASAARSALARSLARELRHTGVTSNAIAAGGFVTPPVEEMMLAAGRRHGWGETVEEIEPKAVAAFGPNDVGRLGRPRECADLVAFLASPRAGYLTGAVLPLDGGS
ncbi:SDR family NAD(P)-dependent oxidoreductase [Streptomyces sp. TRM43335]|uniref:SDR family NAD(P)-dependent oxidoreductase n=1 Tax=Streptomyces taklimakanensis TaxID=2569853 RepID=A0A6G2BFZ3_9ACTN|nr:SDR family NAD(P)-dependent oxidoreductase [Streptomyces taklimakanensis]MTE21124.1 SDR family NAD(P)-dependent oxidoreductase [Streptomyces taklimakanensis]